MKIYLPKGAVPTEDVVAFGTSFPGTWVAGGDGIDPEDLGLTEDEAKEMIEASGVPLVLSQRKPAAVTPEAVEGSEGVPEKDLPALPEQTVEAETEARAEAGKRTSRKGG